MADNGSIVDPSQVIKGTKHTQNTTDTPCKKNFDKGDCGEKVDDEWYEYQEKGVEIVDNRSTASLSKITIGDKNTQNTKDAPLNKNCDQEKGIDIVDDNVDDYQ